MPPRSAYIHVPFCARRCGYCNFTLVAGRDDLIERYLQAIEIELSLLGAPHEVDTLFFGGGTPTHLSVDQLRRLIKIVKRRFPLAGGCEFSVEANPADITPEMADFLAESGVTRVSLGAQSFDAAKLRTLERDHRAEQIHTAVERLRGHSFSLSLDLIFAAPHETLDAWQTDLQAALSLRPDHVSTYGLTFERGTSFWGRLTKSELERIDEDLECQMYAAAIDSLTASGFEHYEVSNFARPGHRCRHNEVYWLGGEYWAAGPGAARHLAGRRETNHRSVTTYLKRVLAGESPVAEAESLPPEDRARELLVFGLRRLEGVSLASFSHRTGFDARELAGRALARHVENGLLEIHADRLRLTRRGLFVSDALWPDFLRQ